MNFLTLVQNLCLLTGKPVPTTVEGTVAQQVGIVKLNVNKAYSDLWLKLGSHNEDADAESAVSTVANQDYIASPYNVVTQVSFSDRKPLILLPWNEFETSYKREASDIIADATPIIASLYRRRIYLWPTPDTVYSLNVRGRAKYVALTLNTDTPLLDTEYHEVLLAVAQYHQAQWEGDPRAQEYGINAERMVNQLMASQNAHWGMPPRVRLESEFMENGWLDQVRVGN